MAASRFSTTADFSIQHIWGTTLDDNTGINHSTQVDPKNYGLQIRGSTKILIDNCLIQQTYGDGIWLGHSAADGNVWTQEVRITNTNVNITARDGIAFGQACEGIYIGRTNFTNIFSQAVDSKPVEQPVRDVVVEHCHLGGWWNPGKPGRAVNAPLSIVGGKFLTGSQTVWARKFRVRDCTIDGACVIESAVDVVLERNRIVTNFDGNSYAPVLVSFFCDDIWVLDNEIYDRTADASAGRHAGSITVTFDGSGDTTMQPSGVTVRGNRIHARHGVHGIQMTAWYTPLGALVVTPAVGAYELYGIGGVVDIIDCYFGHTKGDAIRFLGSDTERVKHVLVKRCVLQMEHTPSSRSALSFQRSADEVTIDACYTRGASSIDFEPTGIGSNVQHRATRNHFVGNVTLSGNGAGQQYQQSIFSNNTVVGTISGGNVEQLVVAKNIVDALVVGALRAEAIGFFERVHDVATADNIWYRSGDANTVLVVSVDTHSVGEDPNVIIDGNIIVNDNNVADGATISLRPVSGTTVHGNMLMNKVSTVDNGFTVRIEATTESVIDNIVTENLGIGTNQALIHGISGGNGNFASSDNPMCNINYGVPFGGTVLEQYPACRNVLVSSITAVRLSGGVPTYIAVESGSLKEPTIFDLRVAPESVVPAAIGSIGLRSSGGGAGTTFYVKEAGNGLSTGWTAK